MKIFLDTAHINSIKKWKETGLIDGITTNPSHLSKEGGDAKKQVLAICALMADSDVSVEVTENDPEKVYNQAKAIAALAHNVVVKIPCHKKYYSVIKHLVDEGVQLNITLVFTLLQGLMMAKLGVKYISPFIGRWDDIDVDGIQLLPEMAEMVDAYGFETQILAASIRGVRHFHDAVLAGADVATVPIAVLEKATLHPLTDQGIEMFNADWQKLGIKQFP
jgi:transaldolase